MIFCFFMFCLKASTLWLVNGFLSRVHSSWKQEQFEWPMKTSLQTPPLKIEEAQKKSQKKNLSLKVALTLVLRGPL